MPRLQIRQSSLTRDEALSWISDVINYGEIGACNSWPWHRLALIASPVQSRSPVVMEVMVQDSAGVSIKKTPTNK